MMIMAKESIKDIVNDPWGHLVTVQTEIVYLLCHKNKGLPFRNYPKDINQSHVI